MVDFLTISLIIVFLIAIIIAYVIGFRSGAFNRDRHWQEEIPAHRKDAIMRSRSVLAGNFSEQLAPYLPDFPFLPTECKFLGKPVDFIVFKGLDSKNIDEVVFVEAKSGNSKLSSQEKSLKDAIKNKRVRWHEYRIPEELTKEKNNNEENDF